MNVLNLSDEDLSEIKEMLKKVDKKLDEMLARINKQTKE